MTNVPPLWKKPVSLADFCMLQCLLNQAVHKSKRSSVPCCSCSKFSESLGMYVKKSVCIICALLPFTFSLCCPAAGAPALEWRIGGRTFPQTCWGRQVICLLTRQLLETKNTQSSLQAHTSLLRP